MPEASGSSVPAWPAFCALKSHLILATASVEPKSKGLSRISQPETGRPLGLRGLDICILKLLVFGAVVGSEIPCNFRRTQELVDLLIIVEARIVAEPHVGHVLHLPKLRAKTAPDEFRIPVQRLDHRVMVLDAERRHVGRGVLEVR